MKKSASLIGLKPERISKAFNFDKKDLIDFTFGRCKPAPRSFADLGGVWGVDAAYAFYTLDTYNIESAFLVDTDFSDEVTARRQKFHNLKVIRGNFGEESVFEQIGSVDAIFLFDVLLHQVKPDWNEILQIYSDRTKYFIVFNQQWIKSKSTMRLLDLGREEYFNNVPHDQDHPTYKALFEKMYEIHPEHQRIWRDIHHVWQWGITDHDLLETIQNFGFTLQYYKNCGGLDTLENIEDHAFVFQKL
jgi:hypothetical protein